MFYSMSTDPQIISYHNSNRGRIHTAQYPRLNTYQTFLYFPKLDTNCTIASPVWIKKSGFISS